MDFKKNTIVSWLSWTLANAALIIFSSYKISYIWGSFAAYFSASGLLIPMVGAFSGGAGVIITNIIRFLILRWTLVSSFHILAYHIPGFCGALSWAYPMMALWVLVPIICMGLFWIHPVGYAAAPYALFWLIPVIAFYIKRNAVISSALAVSFIAHAVGSVIWLYTVPMSAQAWLNLMPIVVVERLIQAAGMVFCYYAIYSISYALYCGIQMIANYYRARNVH